MVDFSPDMKLRIPMGLRRDIEDAAKANRRSLNAEITARLEATFMPDAAALSVHHSISAHAGCKEAVQSLSDEIETLRAEVRALSIQVKAKSSI